MPNYNSELNQIFSALSDPTRRAVLARLSQGPAPVTELAKPFNMALPSFTQHMGVLEKSGLVRSQKKGRTRIYQLSPEPLKTAGSWIAEQQQLWQRRLDQLDSFLANMKEKEQ